VHTPVILYVCSASMPVSCTLGNVVHCVYMCTPWGCMHADTAYVYAHSNSISCAALHVCDAAIAMLLCCLTCLCMSQQQVTAWAASLYSILHTVYVLISIAGDRASLQSSTLSKCMCLKDHNSSHFFALIRTNQSDSTSFIACTMHTSAVVQYCNTT
jgi:hypothetical protein